MKAPASRAGRALLAAASGLAALIALAGFAHTPAGRPLLRAMGRCPVALPGSLPAAEREAGRLAAIAAFRGDAPARARPALMFALGETTRAEADRWASDHGVACRAERSGATVACQNVAAELLPDGYRAGDVDELTLRFDPQSRLVAVVTRRSPPGPAAAARAQADIARSIEAAAGAPFRTAGEPSSLEGSEGLAQVRAEFRFSDYYASSVASRLGATLAIYEEYMLIRGGS